MLRDQKTKCFPYSFTLATVFTLFFMCSLNSQNPVRTDYTATYDLSMISDTVNESYLYRWEYLLIGSNGESRFLEATRHYNDSILAAWYSENPQFANPETQAEIQAAFTTIGTEVNSMTKPTYDGFYTRKDFSQQEVDVALMFTVTREYMNQPFIQNWNIQANYDTINNLRCQQATVTYGGRDYTAWFASEIPIPDGPYVFAGLPGLIVKISDQRGWYTFTLREINTSGSVRYWNSSYLPDDRFLISREEFLHKCDRQKNDPPMIGLLHPTPEQRQAYRESYSWAYHLLLESD